MQKMTSRYITCVCFWNEFSGWKEILAFFTSSLDYSGLMVFIKGSVKVPQCRNDRFYGSLQWNKKEPSRVKCIKKDIIIVNDTERLWLLYCIFLLVRKIRESFEIWEDLHCLWKSGRAPVWTCPSLGVSQSGRVWNTLLLYFDNNGKESHCLLMIKFYVRISGFACTVN